MSPIRHKQQGAVLVLSMLILAVITIVSIAGMRTSTTGEKMSANLRDRNVAFQAAESGLRDAENFIVNPLTLIGAFNGTNGLLGEADAEPDYFDVNTWQGANSQVAANAIAVESNPGGTVITRQIAPRYVIKNIGSDDTCKGSNPITKDDGYGAQDLSCEVFLFRVVARSQGLSPNAEVFLQSYFAATDK